MRKTSYKIKLKIISLTLAILMSTSMFTACNREAEDTENTNDITASVITDFTEAEDTTEKSETDTKKDETTKKSDKKTEKTTSKKITTTKKKTSKTSGLSNKETVVSEASEAKDLKNVDPEEAAKKSSNTEIAEVNVETKKVDEETAEEFPFVAESKFESHITSVWKSLKTTDKVKIKKELYNEYLNYAVLPLKNSFYEINCQGYNADIMTDDTYAYMTITYHYYVNSSQYSQCKSAAQAIVNKATGSTIEKIRYCHDYICAHTTYAIDVDGAYNNLIKGQSDCDGYTAAFQLCMELLGIPCKAFCTTDHIFNLVQISGSWYAVDVTFDDADDYGVALAKYFLLGKDTYSSYSVLNGMLASSNYTYDRKAYIYDESKLKTAMGLDSDAKIIPGNDGYFEVEGLGYFYIS